MLEARDEPRVVSEDSRLRFYTKRASHRPRSFRHSALSPPSLYLSIYLYFSFSLFLILLPTPLRHSLFRGVQVRSGVRIKRLRATMIISM